MEEGGGGGGGGGGGWVLINFLMLKVRWLECIYLAANEDEHL